MGPPSHPRRATTALLLLAAGAALSACESDQPAPDSGKGRELTPELFQELMEQGTLRPVDTMEDPYRSIEPDMGATPEDLAASGEPGANDPLSDGQDGEPFFIPPPINPYIEFGSRIKVYEDTGLIMKPFPIRSGQGEGLMKLIQDYGDVVIYDPALEADLGPQGPSTVLLDLRKDFDSELLSPNLREYPDKPIVATNLSDWLIVKASAENLREIEYFIDLFAAGPPQIEIEAKIVEWVTRDTFDWGVRPQLDLDGNPIPMVTFPGHTAVSDLIWNFPSNAGGTGAGAGVTAIQDGTIYSAMFELLATFENVSIISRPKVAVREGVRAQIQAIEKIPFLDVTSVSNQGVSNSKISYQETGIRLFVTPRLIGTNTVSLEIDIEASQQTGDAAPTQLFGGQGDGGVDSVITVPILSTRSAQTLVYLRPGQAVIIGGLITERSVEQEDKIPFLGDIPLLGYLFKSKSTAKQKAQVLFFLRPRVLEGTDLNRKF